MVKRRPSLTAITLPAVGHRVENCGRWLTQWADYQNALVDKIGRDHAQLIADEVATPRLLGYGSWNTEYVLNPLSAGTSN